VKGFRMSCRFVCLFLLSVFVLLQTNTAEAQRIRRVLERRAALLAPPVDPNAPAAAQAPATAAATPPVEPPVRGGFFARRMQQRRDLVAQQAAEAQPTPAVPGQAPPTAPQQARARAFQALRQTSATAAPLMRALSPVEMKGMDVPALQTALSNTGGELGNELNRFTSAASWQGFLNLPSGVVDEGTIDLAALQAALQRFENVSNDPKFAQISALPSFNQTRMLLTELVNRADVPAADGPQLIDPSGEAELSMDEVQVEETLPAPQPELPRNEGEHSILIQSKKS
jgi:hypothetical protein